MALVETAPHEVKGHLVYTEHGADPYWLCGKLLTEGLGGYAGNVEVPVDGPHSSRSSILPPDAASAPRRTADRTRVPVSSIPATPSPRGRSRRRGFASSPSDPAPTPPTHAVPAGPGGGHRPRPEATSPQLSVVS